MSIKAKQYRKKKVLTIKHQIIFFVKRARKHKFILGIILFIFVFSFIFCFDRIDFSLLDIVNNEVYVDPVYVLINGENTVYHIKIIPVPEEIKDKENPINGVLVTQSEYDELIKRHPVAIVINNFTRARPQHGLSKADLVWEVLSEAGITRYVAVYFGNYDVEKIGPVRSLRYYMIEFASGLADAIILHHGWAGFGKENAVYTEKTDAVTAIYKYGIKNIQTAASTYRDKEKAWNDGYVHSLYTDFGRIVPEIERLQKSKGWELGSSELEPLKFKYDELYEDRGNMTEMDIEFLSTEVANYKAAFRYDKKTNTYKRFIAGKEDIDLITGIQIAPKNVVIEWHDYYNPYDGYSRIVIEVIGENNVTILRDGMVIEGTWKKECRTCRTKYFDELGDEIELVRGQIWVVVAVKTGEKLVSKVNLVND